MKWAADFSLGTMSMGALGRSPVGYTARVEGNTEAEAREAAQAALVEFNGGKGKLTGIVPLYSFAVTVRGRRDKRTRETFVVTAANEDAAVAAVRGVQAAVRFAGYKPEVIRVKRSEQ